MFKKLLGSRPTGQVPIGFADFPVEACTDNSTENNAVSAMDADDDAIPAHLLDLDA